MERQRADGSWYRVEELEANPFRCEDAEESWFQREFVRRSWYTGRNYLLFGVLAGVRAEDGHPLIAPPRGMPEDASDETVEQFASFGADAHTPSWLATEDLVAFDWDQPVRSHGWLYQAEQSNGRSTASQLKAAAAEFERTGILPRSFAISYTQLLGWPVGLRGRRGTYPVPIPDQIEVVWHVPLEQVVVDFLPTVLRMARESSGALATVRAVFWFDN